jgi:hypothetical protein
MTPPSKPEPNRCTRHGPGSGGPAAAMGPPRVALDFTRVAPPIRGAWQFWRTLCGPEFTGESSAVWPTPVCAFRRTCAAKLFRLNTSL